MLLQKLAFTAIYFLILYYFVQITITDVPKRYKSDWLRTFETVLGTLATVLAIGAWVMVQPKPGSGWLLLLVWVLGTSVYIRVSRQTLALTAASLLAIVCSIIWFCFRQNPDSIALLLFAGWTAAFLAVFRRLW